MLLGSSYLALSSFQSYQQVAVIISIIYKYRINQFPSSFFSNDLKYIQVKSFETSLLIQHAFTAEA